MPRSSYSKSAQPVLCSSGLPPHTAPPAPSPLSHHQRRLCSAAPDSLRTRRMPRNSPLSHHQPVLLSSGLPANMVHATQQPTLTPSPQPVLWSSGLPRDTMLSAKPVLWRRSGLPPNTAPATPSPLSPHQPSLSSGAPDCPRTWSMPCSSPLSQHQPWSSGLAPNVAHATKQYSHTISPACPLQLWTASAHGAQ